MAKTYRFAPQSNGRQVRESSVRRNWKFVKRVHHHRERRQAVREIAQEVQL